MALIKTEEKPQNDDLQALQAITTLLTLVLEKSSKIDELDKTIKSINFNPKIVNNNQGLAEEIAEKLKFQGVRINDKKPFIQTVRENWGKYTIVIVLSISLFLTLGAIFYLSKENYKFSKENTIIKKELNFYRTQAQENQPKTTTKSKVKK